MEERFWSEVVGSAPVAAAGGRNSAASAAHCVSVSVITPRVDGVVSGGSGAVGAVVGSGQAAAEVGDDLVMVGVGV